MQINREIIDRITAAKVALSDNDEAAFESHVCQLIRLLDGRYVNFVEFTSFWPAMDVSYSVYRNLSPPERMEFLRDAVRLYIKERHDIYSAHGYTATTIQVRKDFEKHKTGGSAGNSKARKLLDSFQFNPISGARLLSTPRSYIFLDETRDAAVALRQLVARYGLRFAWQGEHQGKSADLLIHGSEGQFYICELKHMKEGGGGQDKQVSELIWFVRQLEDCPNIHYVAFLDGIYFNSFSNPQAPKPREQLWQIEAALSADGNRNYFVNTYGFGVLLQAM